MKLWTNLSREQKFLFLLAVLLLLGLGLRFGVNSSPEVMLESNHADANGSGAGGGPETENGEQDLPEEEPASILIHIAGAVAEPGVYTLAEGERYYHAVEKAGGALPAADLDRVNLAKPLLDGQQVYIPMEREEYFSNEGAAENAKININTASAGELQTLPGIGETRAQAIIDYREQQGPFQDVEDLLHISGIGDRTLEGLRDSVTVY